MTSERGVKTLIQWHPVSERIIKVRFKSKFHNVTIINIYAPTNEKELEEKQYFYDQLQATVEAVPKKDLLIVMGDVNAKTGKDNSGKERIMDQEGLGQCNEN
jgi:exonuclease III